MEINEIIAALAAGLIVGFILAYTEKTFPTSGIGKV